MGRGSRGDRQHRAAQVLALLQQVQDLAGDIVDIPDAADLRDSDVEQLVDEAVAHLREQLAEADGSSDSGRLALLAFRLSEIRQKLSAEAVERRLTGLGNVQVALGKLRSVRSPEEMMNRAPRVLCEQCGFRLAMLMRPGDDGRIIPVSAFHVDDPDWEEKFKDTLTNRRPLYLDTGLIELEMVRRRTAVIVHDVYSDPRTVDDEIFRMSGASAYVAAPIMPEERVIGFLHATHGDEVDIIDRDILWAFAEGYGYALERTILVARLFEHGERMRELMQSTDRVLEELRESDLQIQGSAAKPNRAPRIAAFAGPQSAVHELMTRREIEVVELMAQGHTNKQIAERIIVSEGTAKAHVRQILRKLKAANRAEAVSEYTRMLHRHP